MGPSILTRIRSKIIAIVLMAVIPALIQIFHSAAERKSQVARDIEANAMAFNRFLASNIQRDISEAHGFFAAVAASPVKDGLPPAACRELLASFVRRAEVYENLGVADSSGKIECSAAPLAVDLSRLPWFRKSFTHPALTVGFDFESVLSPRPSLNLAYPLPDGKHVLFANMTLDWINETMASARLPEGTAISIVTADGASVARYPDPDLYRGKALPSFDGDSKEGVSEVEGLDGIRRIYAMTRVPGEGGIVVRVGILKDRFYEVLNHETYHHLTALGIVALLALLAAWFGGDVFLIKPVEALIRVTRRLAEGDLSARTSLRYDKGELGQLAKAFDEMAESLEWRQAQLQESESERMEEFLPFRKALEALPHPVVLLDENLRIFHMNGRAQAVLEADAAEVRGMPMRDLEDRKRCRFTYERLPGHRKIFWLVLVEPGEVAP